MKVELKLSALLLFATMFFLSARAFMTRSSHSVRLNQMSLSPSMFLSTTGSADTSIVDVCIQKIQQALETDVVKVTGEFIINVFP